MADKLCDGTVAMSQQETIIEQLRHGIAQFELVSAPLPSISNLNVKTFCCSASSGDHSHRFFAKMGPTLGSPVRPAKRVERYSVRRVTGDGRCLFRALVKGMALNKGLILSPRQEREDADELRMAVKEIICDDSKERKRYEEALVAITVEESLKRYCQRIQSPDFWGGESELLVLSRLCNQPITVYIPEHQHKSGGYGSGFVPIAEYGAERSREGKAKRVVRLVYSGGNHYDLLVPKT